MIVKKGCPMCGATTAVHVNAEAYENWKAGALIQVAMPNLNPTSREVLISGICPVCQDKIFGGEDND